MDAAGVCKWRGGFAALALLPSLLAGQASPPPPLSRIAFTGVFIVNLETGTIEPERTVVVSGGRIIRVEPGGQTLPRDITLIPSRGQFLIPGLWDMHVHLTSGEVAASGGTSPDFSVNADWQFPLLLAAGVTAVRDMSGAFGQLRSWRNEIAAGQRAGPRIVHTGRKLGPAGAVLPGAPAPVQAAAEVERSVELLARAGAGFVKVDGLSAEQLAAAVLTGKRHGLPVVGHVGPWMSAREASELGLTGIEHLTQVVTGGSTEEAVLLAEARREISWWGDFLVGLGWWDRLARSDSRLARAAASWDSVKATELFAVFARNTTWQTPTLTGLRDVQRIQADIPGERLRWLPPRLIERDSAGRRPANEPLHLLQQRIIPMMAHAGIPILAGTDAPGTRRVPGPSLVEELEALVAAGLTPLQALRSATLNPARFLGLSDSLGTVAPGKVADLVLLDANPLADIAALRQVRGVIAAGRYYSPRDLERRRAEVQALLGRLRANAAPMVAGGGSSAPRH